MRALTAYRQLLDLSLVQLTSGRRVIVIALLATLPPLLALVYLLVNDEGGSTVVDFHDGMMNRLVISSILPLVALVLSTAGFGDEVEDRTLLYLVLKPISRWSISLAKFTAAALVTAVIATASAVTASLLITEGSASEAIATAVAVLLASATYAAIFTWTGLVTRHALPFGLIYVFLWEATLSSLFTGIGFLSVRQYAMAVMHGIDGSLFDERGVVSLSLIEGLVGAAVVIALFAWLTTRRLRLMDVP